MLYLTIKQVVIKLITVRFKISLMDLHQNMSINSWWWDKKILNGCMYHVLRQYTLLWCLRIEQRPYVIRMFDSTPEEQEQDVTVLNGQWSLSVLNATLILATSLFYTRSIGIMDYVSDLKDITWPFRGIRRFSNCIPRTAWHRHIKSSA